MILFNTSIHVKRIKILILRTAEEPWKQFAIDCWNTDNEVLLGSLQVEVLNGDNVKVDSKPGNNVSYQSFDLFVFFFCFLTTHFGLGQDKACAGVSEGSSAS